MSGYLTGYSKKEEYPGVYSVTVKVTEYKAAGVKTTAIPYIKRPGKAPAIPKTVMFSGKTMPYSLQKGADKAAELAQQGLDKLRSRHQETLNTNGTGGTTKSTGGSGYSGGGKGGSRGEVSDEKTGKPVINPATLKDDQAYAYTVSKVVSTSPTVKWAVDTIGNFFSDFTKRFKSGQGIVNKGIGENN